MTCVCGKGESLEVCCGPLLRGERLPTTAEELMRSRYAAYAQGDVDYVVSTHDPERRGDVDRKTTEAWSKQSTWLGLEIKATEGGGPEDTTGTVEFVARYRLKNVTVNHHEIATFRKDGVRWYFVDGKELAPPPVVSEGPRVGRNDPCTCGSGKKYKKCHGKAA